MSRKTAFDVPALAPTLMVRIGVGLSVFALLSLSSVPAIAQRSVRFGLEGGAALTNFAGGAVTNTDWRTSPWIGVTVVTDRPGAVVGLQSGLQVLSKGPSFDNNVGLASVRLRYVEVPLLLRLAPVRAASRVRPAFLVGGVVGVRIGCSVPVKVNGAKSSLDCDTAFFGPQADVQRVDAGLSIGGEIEIPYSKRQVITPTVRYTRGLLNIAADGTNDYHSKNSVVQIGLGIRAR